MNKKDFMDCSNILASGNNDSDLDVFDRYHIDRMNELIEKNTNEIRKAAYSDDLDDLSDRTFDLSKMLTVNEDAILRLYAVALDPRSSRRELLNSFNIFINDVISRHNPALRKLGKRINGHNN